MVSYEFYKNDYHGSSLSVEEWPELEARAADQLAYYRQIYNVTAPNENSESMAICTMAEVFAAIAAAQGGTGAVSSASIGSVSVSYGQASMDLSPRGQAKELYSAAKRYLQIYRG